eukprot:1376030-Prymnesium_polylepis.1
MHTQAKEEPYPSLTSPCANHTCISVTDIAKVSSDASQFSHLVQDQNRHHLHIGRQGSPIDAPSPSPTGDSHHRLIHT